MSFVDNEIFDNVIVGEYRDDNGKIIKNVYTTKDDAALVDEDEDDIKNAINLFCTENLSDSEK